MAAGNERQELPEDRFGFGENWKSFLSLLNEERIRSAEASLKEMLGVETLAGKTFLDIGSGSGLFSLAAYRLGANVTSFDYDKNSVGCTSALKNRYFNAGGGQTWRVEEGSALDPAYLAGLGKFDVVYSWGVLHHTGDMWAALANVTACTRPGSLLFISLYNDEGWRSVLNTKIKLAYVRAPRAGKCLMAAVYTATEAVKGAVIDILRMKNPMDRHRERVKTRGMSFWHDHIDWLGGYPFEVARPGDIVEFYRQRGFELIKLDVVRRGHGCNEYVFVCKPG